jgi:predicted nucleic acid-binding protein
MIALDTNLLIYAHRARTSEHLAAKAAIEAAARHADGWCIPAPVAGEFWSVATHPAAAGGGSTPAQAAGFLRALVAADARLLEPQTGLTERLLDLAEALGFQGPRIFDLRIGLIALEAGATEIWTHDSGFLAPPGLAVHDPLAAA